MGPESNQELEAATERLVGLGDRYLTWPELCRRAGIEHAIADRLWRALGFPDVPPDEPVYGDDDVRALEIAAQGIERLEGQDRDAALEFIVREARSVSAYLTRITEIQVDTLSALQRLGLRQDAIQQAFERGIDNSDLGWLLFYGLRRRLDEALRRRATSEPGDHPVLSVGFIDLVDFTRTSGDLEPEEFGGLLNRFESLVWDVVTEAGGRVVKLIGDEAMLVCPFPKQAGEAALEVLTACGDHELPTARAGLAMGPLLARGGDYFGPAVNLASRLVDRAEPGTVLADQSTRDQLADEEAFDLREMGPTTLKGIGKVPAWRLAREP